MIQCLLSMEVKACCVCAEAQAWFNARRRNGEDMKKRQSYALVVCLSVLLFSGCGPMHIPEVIDSTTVSVEENGQIRYWLVGEFDKDYYEISELNEMAVEEAQKFNAERETVTEGAQKTYPVAVEKVEAVSTNERKVVVSYRFDGWESYSDFNEEDLFFGTVAQAIAAGYPVETALDSVKDDSRLTAEDVKAATERLVVITNVKADIYCPGKVTHISGNAVMNEDGSVGTSGADGLIYILMK